MRNYFMVSEADGHLYDTRKNEWYKNPLRKNYAKVKQNCKNDSIAIRAALREKYVWPGGHELIAIANDGGLICVDCCKQNYKSIASSIKHDINDGWNIIGFCLDETLEEYECCDNCNKTFNI